MSRMPRRLFLVPELLHDLAVRVARVRCQTVAGIYREAIRDYIQHYYGGRMPLPGEENHEPPSSLV